MLTPPNSNHTAPAHFIAKLVKKASELPEDDAEPPSIWLTVDPATAAGTSENTETTNQGSLLIMEPESERLLASGVVPPQDGPSPNRPVSTVASPLLPTKPNIDDTLGWAAMNRSLHLATLGLVYYERGASTLVSWIL